MKAKPKDDRPMWCGICGDAWSPPHLCGIYHGGPTRQIVLVAVDRSEGSAGVESIARKVQQAIEEGYLDMEQARLVSMAAGALLAP